MGKIEIIIGTRPECIKVAPLIREMTRRGLRDNLIVVNTGQHRELMENVFAFFGIRADHTFDVMVPGQSLNELVGRILIQLQKLNDTLAQEIGTPEMMLAQGDTATAFAASMTAFHNMIPFGHIESGLRTHDFNNPFPEEFYRRLISINAFKYFSPTPSASNNLINEGVDPSKILLTGNTVVDSIEYLRRLESSGEPSDPQNDIREERKTVLVTCHRRENFGGNFEKILKAVKTLAVEHPDLEFVWLQHPNPHAKSALANSGIDRLKNISISPPLDYLDLLKFYAKVKILITDSGGLQEEAPSFQIPVIVLRETTERMESVENGYAVLCGADEGKIKEAFRFFVADSIRVSHNPYGDGKASVRIADYLEEFLNPEKAAELSANASES